MSETTKSALPNKAFDMEYSTQTKKEMLYLQEHGFEPCFTKRTADYHIPTYKYKKTSELFKAVAEYYELVESEKSYDKIKKELDASVPAKTETDLNA